MSREDFTNWTPEHCKRVIHEYQKTKDKELFSLLLAKYDKFLVKLALKTKRRLREVPLEDLYHSAIIGFGMALSKFKQRAPAQLIIAVIKAYVTSELDSRYINRRPEEPKKLRQQQYETVDPNDLLDVRFIMDSEYLSAREKEVLTLRFEEDMSFSEIGDKLGMCRQSAHKYLDRVLEKIRVETRSKEEK